MKQTKKNTWIVRCLGYTLTINILTGIIMLLYANFVIKDLTSLIILFGIYIISAPLYSVLKGNSNKPLLYNILTIVGHIVFNFIMISALGHIYKGWETAMFMYTEIFTAIFFVLVVLLDTLTLAIKKQ